MLMNLLMTLQFLLAVLVSDVDSALPQSPTHMLVLVLLGAALLAPIASWASTALVRVLSLATRVPTLRNERTAVRDFRMPEEPGTPGTARPRAPSLVVRASA